MQPASTSAELLQWYEFIGVLMGISLLQKETVLGINLCSVIWKQLVQQDADASDLAAFDEMCVLANFHDQQLSHIALLTCARSGVPKCF